MPMEIQSDAAQLKVHNADDGDTVRFTVEGARSPALVLFRIGRPESAPGYRARWLIDPKLLPAQVAMNIATAVGMYVVDSNRTLK